MLTLRSAFVIACLLGAPWTTQQVRADEPVVTTVVRVQEAPLCDDLRLPTGIVAPECVCAPGAFCLSRAEMETATAAVEDDRACRGELDDIRKKPPTIVESGWSPGEVAALVIGVGVGSLALGFGAGMVVEKFR